MHQTIYIQTKQLLHFPIQSVPLRKDHFITQIYYKYYKIEKTSFDKSRILQSEEDWHI